MIRRLIITILLFSQKVSIRGGSFFGSVKNLEPDVWFYLIRWLFEPSHHPSRTRPKSISPRTSYNMQHDRCSLYYRRYKIYTINRFIQNRYLVLFETHKTFWASYIEQVCTDYWISYLRGVCYRRQKMFHFWCERRLCKFFGQILGNGYIHDS